ncbi:MAG: fumarate reductase subunit C [bacterium]
MQEAKTRTDGGPRLYHRKMPADWWLKNPRYLLFMLREFSSVFVGGYAVVLLCMLWHLKQGEESYARFLDWSKTGPAIGLHIIALAFAVLHTVTWFKATPQAMVIRVGENRVPSSVLIGANYAAWVVVSAFLFWVITRG